MRAIQYYFALFDAGETFVKIRFGGAQGFDFATPQLDSAFNGFKNFEIAQCLTVSSNYIAHCITAQAKYKLKKSGIVRTLNTWPMKIPWLMK